MTAASGHDIQPRLTIDYVREDLARLLDDESTLAVMGFGAAAPQHADPRYLRVGLEPHGAAPFEWWRSRGPVERGTSPEGIGWSEGGALQFGSLEIDELAHEGDASGRRDDIGATADAAYRRLVAFTSSRGYPHVLRVWNYLDGITVGEGDEERYRRFCLGRANGLRAGLGEDPAVLPAATAIGRIGSPRKLQLYWLASRTPGTALENPRQLSAYRYPRQYGPQPPSFARAMLPPEGSAVPLLLSGTAAIVGHQSHHPDSVATQLDETLTNLGCMIDAGRALRPSLPAELGPHSRLKVYVRERDEMPLVAALLDERLGPDVPRIVLHAQVCRRELRIEIDGSHG
ncbi:MAG: pteridine-dependent deoxygenase [Pseudomonadota bacterium]|nr:pteridine-dependent deoxygenase [Pseudomonadota bacterium]